MGVHQCCCKPSSWRKHDQDYQVKVKVGGGQVRVKPQAQHNSALKIYKMMK